jgi:hypothetical protein
VGAFERGMLALVIGSLAAFGCAKADVGRYVDAGVWSGGGDVSDLSVTDEAVPDDFTIATGGDIARPLCYAPNNGGEFCPPSIFVSPMGDDAKPGTSPADAVRHINVGILRALSCTGVPCLVLIAGGQYQEQVTLHESVNLYGGYSADFLMRDPGTNIVDISSAEERTVIADGLVLPTYVDGIHITGATLGSADGRSSYALWVSSSHSALTISRSVITGGRGADGIAGTSGAALSCGTTPASGGTAFDCGGSTGGYGTSAGDAVAGGTAGTGGNSNCPDACPLVGGDGISDGADGKPGGVGTTGTGGTATSDLFGSFAAGVWQGALGNAGARGTNGTGGGGGGSGGTKRIRACFGCGTLLGGRGGDGGPGGCGGGGGAPGGAGGGAFAVVIIDSELTFDTVTVAGGTGGTGGRGGDGRAGQAGSTAVDNGREGGRSAKCGLINYYSGAGGHGGVGGQGGPGGGGAGGVGGAAITVVRVGSAALTRVGTVQVAIGSGGVGGAGGQGPGNAGAGGPTGAATDDRAY